MESVTVRHVSVPMPNWPSPLDGLRIAHLTDLHLRKWNRTLLDARAVLLGIEHDLLAVTGDLCHRPDELPAVVDLARRFFAPIYNTYGTFAVLGNHDNPQLADAADVNLTFLRNECASIRHNGVTFAVAGVEQTEGSPGDLTAALADVTAPTPTMLLAHYPSAVYAVAADRVGLVLAGHTHGGQIRVPLLGCVWAHDRIPTRLARGLHGVDGVQLHVSAGIGLSGPIRWRFCCPPELTILTLRATAPAETAEPSKQERLPLRAVRRESPVPV